MIYQATLYCLAAFLLGSFPTAYIVAKKIKGIDIRQHGSGNVGATNAFRVLGKKWGIFVFAVDFFKGALPVILAKLCLSIDATLLGGVALLIGVCAILGHIFSPFLGFRGGKGVATGAGVLLTSFPALFFISALVWYTTFKLFRMVSLSSLIALLSMFILSLFVTSDHLAQGLFLALLILISWSHRSNIQRILRGEEPKFINKTNK